MTRLRDHSRDHAVAGEIDGPDTCAPGRVDLPRVIVCGASESGPRFLITRELGLDLAVSIGAEPSAPTTPRRPSSRPR